MNLWRANNQDVGIIIVWYTFEIAKHSFNCREMIMISRWPKHELRKFIDDKGIFQMSKWHELERASIMSKRTICIKDSLYVGLQEPQKMNLLSPCLELEKKIFINNFSFFSCHQQFHPKYLPPLTFSLKIYLQIFTYRQQLYPQSPFKYLPPLAIINNHINDLKLSI